MKRVYTQTFPEERIKVDDTIDKYFESFLDPKEEMTDGDRSDEEIFKALKALNSEGWREAILQIMQHEMQHKTKKA